MPPENQPQIDWARIDRWTEQLSTGDVSDIRDTFRMSYGDEPSVTWSPRQDSIASDKLRFLLDYWQSLSPDGKAPLASSIDPLRMGPALGYVTLVDVVDGGRDFRYRLYGTVIAAVSEFDMTGRLLSALNASPLVVEFGIATYRAVFRRREAVYVVRAPAGASITSHWHRLTMPLTDDSGAVIRFLSGSVPISHDGRPLAGRL